MKRLEGEFSYIGIPYLNIKTEVVVFVKRSMTNTRAAISSFIVANYSLFISAEGILLRVFILGTNLHLISQISTILLGTSLTYAKLKIKEWIFFLQPVIQLDTNCNLDNVLSYAELVVYRLLMILSN